jgi:hypothetical protein
MYFRSAQLRRLKGVLDDVREQFGGALFAVVADKNGVDVALTRHNHSALCRMRAFQ